MLESTYIENERVEPNTQEQRSSDRRLYNETDYKAAQDELLMFQEYHLTFEVYAQTLRHHHQQMQTLYQSLLNDTGTGRDQDLQNYQQTVLEHHSMTQSYHQSVQDYRRLVREHRQRAFPKKEQRH